MAIDSHVGHSAERHAGLDNKCAERLAEMRKMSTDFPRCALGENRTCKSRARKAWIRPLPGHRRRHSCLRLRSYHCNGCNTFACKSALPPESWSCVPVQTTPLPGHLGLVGLCSRRSQLWRSLAASLRRQTQDQQTQARFGARQNWTFGCMCAARLASFALR